LGSRCSVRAVSEIRAGPIRSSAVPELKIKLRWHDVRHFAVSLWIEQGFSIKEMMTFAGIAGTSRRDSGTRHDSGVQRLDALGTFPTPAAAGRAERLLA
jgi:hypothetical protein